MKCENCGNSTEPPYNKDICYGCSVTLSGTYEFCFWRNARYLLESSIFHLILKPLIKRNYRLRRDSAVSGDGKHPDKWYWADALAVKFGYFVS